MPLEGRVDVDDQRVDVRCRLGATPAAHLGTVQTMDHVLLIGGPLGAGKTTVARRHGLRLYSSDARTWESMTPEERATADPEELVAMSLHHERGGMGLDDLRALLTYEGTARGSHAVGTSRRP